MNEYDIISCPGCTQRLRIPSTENPNVTLKIECPTCGEIFLLQREPEPPKPLSSLQPPKEKRKLPTGYLILAGFVLLVSIIALIDSQINKTERKQPISFTAKKSDWITVSYSDLLDKKAIIRNSGQTLGEALLDTTLKGAVQPFVDKYSYLLQPAVEMLLGHDSAPYQTVIDHFPLGSKQPAWVAIFRGGRIFVTSDNNNHARVFLLGENPETAYRSNYSIIRHCLAALLPGDSSKLKVEVFAYKNNYQRSELVLNPKPFILETNAFSQPSGIVPIDIYGLADFFDQGAQLEGAKLDRDDGLILYGKRGPTQTMAGTNITLADFAVAYRAVFHAGDNEAFISLDSHNDPTKVTVNFGGFLEDTPIGSVVLEADKRFKTITSGLDPVSFRDLRSYTRSHVPSFLTGAERDLLDVTFLTKEDWIGTRFWFYPDSIEIDADFDNEYAKIVKPQFTADAERSRDDFLSPDEFESRKRNTLSPSIRFNIDHLNNNYPQYQAAYSELRELTAVARLLGISSWLKRAEPSWIDLDALLSVELPSFPTEREKTQLVAATLIAYPKSETISEDYVKRLSTVVFLSPILDRTVRAYFSNVEDFAKFLCYKENVNEKQFWSHVPEARAQMSLHQNSKVRELIDSKEDLKALATYAASRLDFPAPPSIQAYKNQIKTFKAELERVEIEIEGLKEKMENANSSQYNTYVNEYNRLVDQYEGLHVDLNSKADIYNQLEVKYPYIVEIGGGINLEPRHFNIKKTSSSPKLREFKAVAQRAEPKWSFLNASEEWLRSKTQRNGSIYKNSIPKLPWVIKEEFKIENSTFKKLAAGEKQRFWSSIDTKTKSWQDLTSSGIRHRERKFEGERKVLHIAEYRSGNLETYVTGKLLDEKTITFSKSSREDLLKPKDPPIWWIAR